MHALRSVWAMRNTGMVFLGKEVPVAVWLRADPVWHTVPLLALFTPHVAIITTVFHFQLRSQKILSSLYKNSHNNA